MRLMLLALCAAAGCGGSKENLYDQLLKENGPALTKRLATLRAVIVEAKKRPALTPPKLTKIGDGMNEFIGLEETTVLDDHGYQGQPGCHPNYSGDVYALQAGHGVRQDNPDAIADMIRRDFKDALTPPYAMVCVQLASAAPVKSGDGFTAGTYHGECRFFDLANGSYLGGVDVATQLQSAAINTRNGRGLDEAMGAAVTTDLGKAIAATGVMPDPMFCSWPAK